MEPGVFLLEFSRDLKLLFFYTRFFLSGQHSPTVLDRKSSNLLLQVQPYLFILN